MFSRIAVVLMVLSLTGCALFEERKGPETAFGPRDQIFNATFEEVWRAANLVLQPYPLRISNMDQGVLETDTIHGYKIWTPPYKPEAAGPGKSYKLAVKLLRGNFSGRNAIKVSISKDASIQQDFFSDPRPTPSDGMEEKSLLYRISREIQIERALSRAQKRKNKRG